MSRPAAPDAGGHEAANNGAAPPCFDASFRSLLTELFRWRRDVRRFRCDPVDANVIEELVALATLAPSVGHSQPWRFVSVEDAERRRAVIDNFNRCNAAALASYEGEAAALYARLKLAGLCEAPVHLAVFCEKAPDAGHGLGRMTMPETLAYSVVGAVQNLALAARAHGLGVGWISILDPGGNRGDPRRAGRMAVRRLSLHRPAGGGASRPRARKAWLAGPAAAERGAL